MAENASFFLLCVIALCLMAMTVSLFTAAYALHRLFRQIATLLPAWTSTAQEAHRTLSEARHLLVRTNKVVHQAQEVTQRVSRSTTNLLEQLLELKERAFGFWGR